MLAGRVVWLTVAGILAAPAVVAACGGGDWLTFIAKALSVPHADCALCGMTRAYLAIGSGDWGAAHTLNAGALPLYLASCGNATTALVAVAIGRSGREKG